MPDRLTILDAWAEDASPDLERLAQATAFAVRVDPGLLRRMRLAVCPGLDAGAEADLWFSPLTEFRSPEGFTYFAEIADALRSRLAQDVDAYETAWQVTKVAHDGYLAPALFLEEEVLYWAHHPEAEDAGERVQHKLRQAVAALVGEERNGLAPWAARALRRLPARVKTTEAGQALALATLARGTATDLQDALADDRSGASSVPMSKLVWAWPSADTHERTVDVGLKRYAHHLEIASGDALEGESVFAAGASAMQRLAMPYTSPLVLELERLETEAGTPTDATTGGAWAGARQLWQRFTKRWRGADAPGADETATETTPGGTRRDHVQVACEAAQRGKAEHVADLLREVYGLRVGLDVREGRREGGGAPETGEAEQDAASAALLCGVAEASSPSFVREASRRATRASSREEAPPVLVAFVEQMDAARRQAYGADDASAFDLALAPACVPLAPEAFHANLARLAERICAAPDAPEPRATRRVMVRLGARHTIPVAPGALRVRGVDGRSYLLRSAPEPTPPADAAQRPDAEARRPEDQQEGAEKEEGHVSPKERLVRGRTLFEAGRYEDALAAYDEALRAAPARADALHGRAQALARLKRYEEALAAYDEAVRLDPSRAQAHRERGHALLDLGRYDEALAAYDEAARLAPDAPAPAPQPRPAEADAAADAPAAPPSGAEGDPDQASTLRARGTKLSDLGRYEDALAALDEALRLDPDHAAMHLDRGDVLRKLGRWEAALAAYDTALRHDLALARAHEGRGRALHTLARHDEALAAYDEALRLDPARPFAQLGRARALKALARYDEALAACEGALRLDPASARAHVERGRLFSQQQRHEEALAAFDQALRHAPEHPGAWWHRGRVLSNALGRPQDARRAFLRVLHLARHAARPRHRRTARARVPDVLDRLEPDADSLLFVTTIERHGLADLPLHEAARVAQAHERARLYFALEAFVDTFLDGAAREDAAREDAARHGTLLGLAAFLLDDPITARAHLDRLDTRPGEADLRGWFYRYRAHDAQASDTTTDLVLSSARDHARDVLAAADRDEPVAPVQLYYAGLLFAAHFEPLSPRAQPMRPRPREALACFERAAARSFLPARYMQAFMACEMDGPTSAPYRSAVESVLYAERARARAPSEAPGFLASTLHRPASPGADTAPVDTTPARLLAAVERNVWHAAHASELEEARRLVRRDLDARRDDEGRLPPPYAFADEPRAGVEVPARSSGPSLVQEDVLNALAEQVETQRRAVDLPALREVLGPHAPTWIDDESLSLEEMERRAGRLIRVRCTQAEAEAGAASWLAEVLTYLGLAGRLAPRALLALWAYRHLAARRLGATDASPGKAEPGASPGPGALLGNPRSAGTLLSKGLGALTPLRAAPAARTMTAFCAHLARTWEEGGLPPYATFKEHAEEQARALSDPSAIYVERMADALAQRQAEIRGEA